LADLQLTTLASMMRSVYAREKTGRTETEKIVGAVALNANATISDYLRAMEAAEKSVQTKYNAVFGN
ncbi:MAG: hypothetical protein LBB08_00210, partial [Rickettsiales bacterium]|jgi:hypothetical protein|nr:hypothetical protein [Rickettsiales bacterium]